MRTKSSERRIALVTGASGGIGSATAKLLAAQDWEIAVHYSSDAKGAAAALAGVRAAGSGGRLFKADLLDLKAAEGLVGKVVAAFGRLDLLVNNAGAVLGQEPFTELAAAEFERSLRLNLTAPFLLAREAFKAMRARGGRIVNISSISAKFGGSPRSMHYSAAKAGVEALTVGLAREGAPHGILVNTVRCGVLDTPFHGKFRKDMSARAALIPLKRLGTAEDAARMIVHLAGTGGDFITGALLPVTGGE